MLGSKALKKMWRHLTAVTLSFISGFFLIQACPDPAVTQGYLGNLGTTSGNCETLPLPPLCAFGSLSINQNAPLQPVNRLNPTQLPTTNNFQLFQNPCAIDQTNWSDNVMVPNNVTAGAGTFRMRCGPFLVGMARTGPVATIAQFNFNNNINFPNLSADNRITFFFSATETNGTSNDFFNVSTNVVNAQTCVLTYTPRNGAPGTVTDYNVIGNVFHDVDYDNLTPALAISNPLVTDGTGMFLSVDGGTVQSVPFGTTVTGKIFQFFVQRYAPLGPAVYVLYAVDNGDNPITLKVINNASDHFIFTAQTPYTGFLRLAAISTNDPAPTVGSTWTQASFFMPEDIGNAADTSNPPFALPIENPAGPAVTSESWWKTVEVDAIAPTGMNFYMLFPNTWASLFTSLATKTIGPTWMNTAGTIQFPTTQALTDILPVIAMQSYTTANGYYNDFFNALNPTATAPFTDGSDFATNFFLVQFDMIMASNLVTSGDIPIFQSTSRTFPSYVISAPVNNVAVYTTHRRYIPVQADVATTATSISWTYTLSSQVPPGDGMNKALVCFPFWKYLQGIIPGMVNTVPGGGEPLQNYIFNDTIKGTLYTAEAINGIVTFLEGGIPSWYTPTDLFIPSTLTFTPTQITTLQTAFNQIRQEIIPLPFFPENRLDPAYNAGKTCYMLAKTGLYAAFFLQRNGTPVPSIIAQTQPFIDNAKSCLTAYLLGRTPGSSYFVADRTSGGICVNGAGGDGTWALGPNLQQDVDSGEDFGNYVYNDHHFFAGYFLVASAMVTNWEMLYAPSQLWIDLPVLGADNQTYKVRDMIDFLWRDVHNPFTNDPTQQIFDPDLPYNRYGFPWEGHSIANGLQYLPNALGRNQESISEDFNCWLGMNAYANLVLQTPLTALETVKYQTLRDFSLMNLKMTASAGIQWYKIYPFWKGVNMFQTNPTFLGPSIYIGQFTQASVTNGEVNDTSAQNQTFF